MPATLKKYVEKHLAKELRAIQNSGRKDELALLSDYEKAIIYKYTYDGYAKLNALLRASDGVNSSDYGIFLEKSLRKLPKYGGIVYRAADLTKSQIALYLQAHKDKAPIVESAFISTTKIRSIAKEFRSNCLFRIVSKSGKEIEKISKFGIHNPPNEYEVLFSPNSKFDVLNIEENDDGTILVTLEEV